MDNQAWRCTGIREALSCETTPVEKTEIGNLAHHGAFEFLGHAAILAINQIRIRQQPNDRAVDGCVAGGCDHVFNAGRIFPRLGQRGGKHQAVVDLV